MCACVWMYCGVGVCVRVCVCVRACVWREGVRGEYNHTQCIHTHAQAQGSDAPKLSRTQKRNLRSVHGLDYASYFYTMIYNIIIMIYNDMCKDKYVLIYLVSYKCV